VGTAWSEIALDALEDPVVVMEPVRDEAGLIIDFAYRFGNTAACAYNGVTRDQLLGTTLLELFPGMDSAGLLQPNIDVLATGEPLVLTDVAYRNEAHAGEERRYDIRTVKAGGAVVVIWRDVTERFHTVHDLREAAYTDSLTGVATRTGGLATLRRSMVRDQRTGEGLAVVFLDVDGLKATNDRLGHAAGDALLRATALRIRGAVRSNDLVMRVGGDEMVVLLHGAGTAQVAADIAEKIRHAVSLPLLLDGHVVAPRVSLGVTMAVEDDTVDSVLDRADAAMYESKRHGGDRTTVG
jgi:diguanylate cyclase (GGDEF)-like protein